jgi:hypothetical protein
LWGFEVDVVHSLVHRIDLAGDVDNSLPWASALSFRFLWERASLLSGDPAERPAQPAHGLRGYCCVPHHRSLLVRMRFKKNSAKDFCRGGAKFQSPRKKRKPGERAGPKNTYLLRRTAMRL